MNEKVYKIAREIFKQEPRLWIGVNALVEQRKYTYDKSGLPVSTVRTGNDVVFWCMLHVQQTPISSQPVQKDIKSCRTFIAT